MFFLQVFFIRIKNRVFNIIILRWFSILETRMEITRQYTIPKEITHSFLKQSYFWRLGYPIFYKTGNYFWRRVYNRQLQ